MTDDQRPAFLERDHAATRIAPKPSEPGWRYTDSVAVLVDGFVVQTTPAFTRLWEELRCLGFFGLGTGYEVAALQGAQPVSGTPAHCSRCPVADECWTRHRGRVAALLPELVEAFDRIADEHAGDPVAMYAAWSELVGSDTQPDPYVAVMGGNLEDGAHIAISGQPRDRGEPFTLPWPPPGDQP